MDFKRIVLAAVAVAILGAIGMACGDDDDGGSSRGVVVTFSVVDGEEFYKIFMTDPADIEIARKLLAGEEAPSIPNGKVVRTPDQYNTGYSWHIDPDDLDWADVTVEVCDGRPSDVEDDSITSDRYCPWDAKVIEIEEV